MGLRGDQTRERGEKSREGKVGICGALLATVLTLANQHVLRLPFHTVAGATPMKQKTLRNLEKGTLQAAKYTGSQCGCRKKYSVLDLAAEP